MRRKKKKGGGRSSVALTSPRITTFSKVVCVFAGCSSRSVEKRKKKINVSVAVIKRINETRKRIALDLRGLYVLHRQRDVAPRT